MCWYHCSRELIVAGQSWLVFKMRLVCIVFTPTARALRLIAKDLGLGSGYAGFQYECELLTYEAYEVCQAE